MALQIHGVMKEAQDLNHIASLIMSNPEHDEMTPFATFASDVKHGESLGDVVAFSCTPVSAINMFDGRSRVFDQIG